MVNIVWIYSNAIGHSVPWKHIIHIDPVPVVIVSLVIIADGQLACLIGLGFLQKFLGNLQSLFTGYILRFCLDRRRAQDCSSFEQLHPLAGIYLGFYFPTRRVTGLLPYIPGLKLPTRFTHSTLFRVFCLQVFTRNNLREHTVQAFPRFFFANDKRSGLTGCHSRRTTRSRLHPDCGTVSRYPWQTKRQHDKNSQ